MTIRVFKSPLFETYLQEPELRQAAITLYDDFKAYINKGRQSEFAFGRDSKYDHSDSPEWLRNSSLRHVHVLTLDEFRRQVREERRSKYNISSDMHVIYCNVDYNGQRYVSAIAAVFPDAHNFARSHKDAMRKCVDIAEKFESHIISVNRKPALAAYLNPNRLTASHGRITASIIKALLPVIFPHHHLFTES